MHARKGQIEIASLLSDFDLNYKRLERMFKKQVGLSPKAYSKVVRVQHILQQLEAAPGQKLVELAYHAGYFDQAHFIREFRSVTGVTPRQHLRSA